MRFALLHALKLYSYPRFTEFATHMLLLLALLVLLLKALGCTHVQEIFSLFDAKAALCLPAAVL